MANSNFAREPEGNKPLERATDKMLDIIKTHLSKFSANQQRRKWDALEQYVKNLTASHAKQR